MVFRIKNNDGTERRFMTLYLMKHERKDLTPEQQEMMRIQREKEQKQKVMMQEQEEKESPEKKPLL